MKPYLLLFTCHSCSSSTGLPIASNRQKQGTRPLEQHCKKDSARSAGLFPLYTGEVEIDLFAKLQNCCAYVLSLRLKQKAYLSG